MQQYVVVLCALLTKFTVIKDIEVFDMKCVRA